MDQRYIRRQIDRTPAFELATVGLRENGKTDALAPGRAEARSGVYSVLGQPIQAGMTALMLAGGDSDKAAILGQAPFIGG